jgi:hypothetical protein
MILQIIFAQIFITRMKSINRELSSAKKNTTEQEVAVKNVKTFFQRLLVNVMNKNYGASQPRVAIVISLPTDSAMTVYMA